MACHSNLGFLLEIQEVRVFLIVPKNSVEREGVQYWQYRLLMASCLRGNESELSGARRNTASTLELNFVAITVYPKLFASRTKGPSLVAFNPAYPVPAVVSKGTRGKGGLGMELTWNTKKTYLQVLQPVLVFCFLVLALFSGSDIFG